MPMINYFSDPSESSGKDVSPLTITLVLSVFAAYATVQIWVATLWGAGLTPDSINYLSSAQSILKTGSLSGLTSQWPPGYPLAIALSGLFSDDLLLSLRWLQILTLVANIFAFSLIIHLNTRSIIATIVGATLLATSATFLRVTTMAWSEGLFSLFTLIGFAFLNHYISNKDKTATLLISACLLGISALLRYSGIAALITAPVILLLCSNQSLARRSIYCFFYTVISSAPLLIWLIYNHFREVGLINREVVLHPITIQKLTAGMNIILSWFFLPENGYLLFLFLIAILLILYHIYVRTNNTDTDKNNITEIGFLYIFIYIAFHILSITIIDNHTPLNSRILSPIYIFLFLSLIILFHSYLHRERFINIIGIAGLFSILLLAVFHSIEQQKFVDESANNGIGWANKHWHESETIQWIKSQPETNPIYTNTPEPISLYTNRNSLMIPRHTDPKSNEPNGKFVNEFSRMVKTVNEKDGAIVFFDIGLKRWYLPTPREFYGFINNTYLFYRLDDGIIAVPKKLID